MNEKTEKVEVNQVKKSFNQASSYGQTNDKSCFKCGKKHGNFRPQVINVGAVVKVDIMHNCANKTMAMATVEELVMVKVMIQEIVQVTVVKGTAQAVAMVVVLVMLPVAAVVVTIVAVVKIVNK